MDIKSYIESGILELYVAGALSEQENEEVHQMILQYPEIKHEVEQIESAIVNLTASVAPSERRNLYPLIIKNIQGENPKDDTTKVVPIQKTTYNWVTYTGWAAALFLAAALIWMFNTRNRLETVIANQRMEMVNLEDQVEEARQDALASQKVLATIRARDIIEVPLAGQTNFENAYAKVYWDKETDEILLDAQGLPEPPRGKVYQVWSLKLSPLTPTSLGTLDTFLADDNKIFNLINEYESEAFGITLEPEGGSESPTMEQLYTLGAVSSSPGQ